MNLVAEGLRTVVELATPSLLGFGEPGVSTPPAPGKWSAKQVLGHLVDSATNNHARFVRAQLAEDLVFPGYEQAAWVELQRYQESSWPDLVTLWRLYNLHLAQVIAAIPAEARLRARARHNLHLLAWRPVPEEQPATLEYFLRDYVGHLNHHLRQIFRALGDVPPDPAS